MNQSKHRIAATLAAVLAIVICAAPFSAQDKQKREYIEATAQGTSTQLGRMAGMTIIINEYSTADDQKALLEAFEQKGSEGLANALNKMHSKGRISLVGTLGYDVNYIREFKLPDGSRKIRMITDRPIAFGEAWSSSRSMDYSLTAAEIIIAPDKKNSHGTLLPACQFKIDKEKELEIENLQNPWKIINIRVSN